MPTGTVLGSVTNRRICRFCVIASTDSRRGEVTLVNRDRQIVYIVDDETVIAETLTTILRRAGFAARFFENAHVAMKASESAPPDLLITDVMMPDMNGVELAIHFRNKCPECKILLLSGKAASADLLEGARTNGYEFEFLLKPVHPTELLLRLGVQPPGVQRKSS